MVEEAITSLSLSVKVPFLPYSTGEELPMPSKYLESISADSSKYSTDFDWLVSKETLSDYQQLNILKNVIAQLVNNSKKLDSDIVKLVNEHFWDLV